MKILIVCIVALVTYNAEAQVRHQYQFDNGLSGQSVDVGGGVRQYQFSDGRTGQSVDVGGGIRQYQFSDGTQGQRYSPRSYGQPGLGFQGIGID